MPRDQWRPALSYIASRREGGLREAVRAVDAKRRSSHKALTEALISHLGQRPLVALLFGTLDRRSQEKVLKGLLAQDAFEAYVACIPYVLPNVSLSSSGLDDCAKRAMDENPYARQAVAHAVRHVGSHGRDLFLWFLRERPLTAIACFRHVPESEFVNTIDQLGADQKQIGWLSVAQGLSERPEQSERNRILSQLLERNVRCFIACWDVDDIRARISGRDFIKAMDRYQCERAAEAGIETWELALAESAYDLRDPRDDQWVGDFLKQRPNLRRHLTHEGEESHA